MKPILAGLAALAALWAAPAAAAPLDCPLRDAPFSASSPLVDVLLNPRAKALIAAETGSALDNAPAQFLSTKAPTFAAILTLKEAGFFLKLSPEKVAAMDAQLRRIPVTAADRAARCARYDNDRPVLPKLEARPRLLLFEKINGFRDGPSVDAGHTAFVTMAERKGWQIVTTDKGGAFRPEVLKQFDAVVWNNISGDVLTLTQRRAFQSYMAHGGAFVGVHGSAGDPVWFWDWYVDGLLGARFTGHPMSPQFQDARVVVDDPAHPAAAHLPADWTLNEEWYSFRASPRGPGTRVIARLDEASYKPEGFGGQNLRMGDHPIAWTRCIGATPASTAKPGRMFYSAIGHRPEMYTDPRVVALMEDGIGWALDRAACKAATP